MVPQIAATGVDLISIGWLTHSTSVLNIGLDFKRECILPSETGNSRIRTLAVRGVFNARTDGDAG
jgi:hypothetical protein